MTDENKTTPPQDREGRTRPESELQMMEVRSSSFWKT
jgi:hypothetical protein